MSKLRKVTLIHGDKLPLHAQSVERNAPCKCGSGKKAKKCCGDETKYFKSKEL